MPGAVRPLLTAYAWPPTACIRSGSVFDQAFPTEPGKALGPGGYNSRVKQLVRYYEDEDGGYVAECLTLPGCISYGKTLDEAKSSVREAIELALDTRRELGLPEYVPLDEVEVA